MVKNNGIVAVFVAILLAIPVVLSAGTLKYEYDEGTCDNGNTWYAVSCYNDGVLQWIEGVDCSGKRYTRWECTVHAVPVDPTAGLQPTHMGIASTGGTWRSVITWDSMGIPVSAAGVAGDGTFYVVQGL